ncbi:MULTISPECIES: DUF2269 family protein [unclassified Bacillus (in: firmicutes)]|uniref:DUF2269 family protein n=1 Tax=unclassified Bacillus (in: firmicutes) TaxID=185979 RepID=UPI0008E5AD0D|nr:MULTISPECIES: DUF2269 family protein [unclassified Bacillus (in: firmicutes)]SFB08382.1 Predicted integral membrane protein [Bacillus sp. UNCCL13]SFQ87087.1 Predicted integral membrane protein [Bacillus sp. cl95]
MTLYSFIVLIHVIAAVTGLGASFAMPVVMKSAKNATQARFSLELNTKIEIFAKVGSIILLATGLILGFINTGLFSQGWYIASLLIYVLVQPIVAGIMPKKMKQMDLILKEYKGDTLPDSYNKLNAELKPFNGAIHAAAVILIVLMSVKPF